MHKNCRSSCWSFLVVTAQYIQVSSHLFLLPLPNWALTFSRPHVSTQTWPETIICCESKRKQWTTKSNRTSGDGRRKKSKKVLYYMTGHVCTFELFVLTTTFCMLCYTYHPLSYIKIRLYLFLSLEIMEIPQQTLLVKFLTLSPIFHRWLWID